MKKMKREYVPVDVEIAGKKFRIQATLIGEMEPREDPDFELPHYVYNVKVKRLDVPSGEFEFKFHSSYHDYAKGKKRLSKEDLIFAFKCALGDALSFLNTEDIDDFAAEFGIEKPSKAIRLYEACKKTYFDVREKLKLTDDDLYELVDAITEMEEEW